MADEHRDLALRLGTMFTAVSERFLTSIAEAVTRSPKWVSFSMTVKAQVRDGGVVACQAIPHAPKIPTEEVDPVHFVLKQEPNGQLSFLFPGTVEEMVAHARMPEPFDEDDYYHPARNPDAKPGTRPPEAD